MATYIALLRGINISGHNIIKMSDFRRFLTNSGFINVKTYIQTGNIIFESELLNTTDIEEQISVAITKRYHYTISVHAITKQQLQNIYLSNPFLEKEFVDITKLYVTILKNKPNKKDIPLLENYCTNQEEFKIIDKVIYTYSPNGVGRSKFTNNVIESKLKTSATSRNWKTITKLVELSAT
jgi:uncharacterized protein (DUF1697 family)